MQASGRAQGFDVLCSLPMPHWTPGQTRTYLFLFLHHLVSSYSSKWFPQQSQKSVRYRVPWESIANNVYNFVIAGVLLVFDKELGGWGGYQ